MARKTKKRSAKARKRTRARDKTIEAAFKGEVNMREKKVPNKRIYSRKSDRAYARSLKRALRRYKDKQ